MGKKAFPWESLIAMLGMAVAAFCVRIFITDPFDEDIVIFNGYRADGPAHGVSQLSAVLAMAGVFGGVGLVALRACFRRISGPTRVDPRVFGDHLQGPSVAREQGRLSPP